MNRNTQIIKIAMLASLSLAAPQITSAQEPDWWPYYKVKPSGAAASDYSPVAAGQLKHIAMSAIEEVALSKFSATNGGAGSSLVATYQSLKINQDDFNTINGGQLKNLGQGIYQRLGTTFPAWTSNLGNYEMVNIGQTKNLFSLSIGATPKRYLGTNDAGNNQWGNSPWVASLSSPPAERERKFKITDSTFNSELQGESDIVSERKKTVAEYLSTVFQTKGNDPDEWALDDFAGQSGFKYITAGNSEQSAGPDYEYFVDFYYDDVNFKNAKSKDSVRLRTRIVSPSNNNTDSHTQFLAWRNGTAMTAGFMERIEHQAKFYEAEGVAGARPVSGFKSSMVFPAGFQWGGTDGGYYEVTQYRDRLRSKELAPGVSFAMFENSANIQKMLWPLQKGYKPSTNGAITSSAGIVSEAATSFLAKYYTGMTSPFPNVYIYPRAVIVSQRWRTTLRVSDTIRNACRNKVNGTMGGEVMLCSFDTTSVYEPVAWISHQVDPVNTPLPPRRTVFSELEFQIDEEWSVAMSDTSNTNKYALYVALQTDLWKFSKIGRDNFRASVSAPLITTVSSFTGTPTSPIYSTKYQQALKSLYPLFSTQP